MTDPKCKKCRRAGQKLFLKGERCYTQKCAMIRRAYMPGARGRTYRRRLSEYGQQLGEKQKLRLTYGVSESQLKRYFKEIVQQRGNKEALFVQKLETRLDNVVFRLGWAKSRPLARQLVSHGHILVNGRKVTIPSYAVKPKDIVKIKEKSKTSALFTGLKTSLKKYKSPAWLSLDKQKLEGEVKTEPEADNLAGVGQISMVIEYYSR